MSKVGVALSNIALRNCSLLSKIDFFDLETVLDWRNNMFCRQFYIQLKDPQAHQYCFLYPHLGEKQPDLGIDLEVQHLYSHCGLIL